MNMKESDPMGSERWSENVIIADADYIDKVAFDLTVNFERMIGRRIPPADMARWLVCVALDGGMRARKAEESGMRQTQVVLIHDKRKTKLDYFKPAGYDDELDGKAFSDDYLGEFTIAVLPREEMVSKEDFFCDALMHICNHKDVRRVMAVPDTEHYYEGVRHALRDIDDEEKRVTVFAMQPMPGGPFRQEILGYSLMNALGIKADEIR